MPHPFPVPACDLRALVGPIGDRFCPLSSQFVEQGDVMGVTEQWVGKGSGKRLTWDWGPGGRVREAVDMGLGTRDQGQRRRESLTPSFYFCLAIIIPEILL